MHINLAYLKTRQKKTRQNELLLVNKYTCLHICLPGSATTNISVSSHSREAEKEQISANTEGTWLLLEKQLLHDIEMEMKAAVRQMYFILGLRS